ncbi:MAG: hypothetical protein ACRCZR_02240 [Cetobacterium sp.]
MAEIVTMGSLYKCNQNPTLQIVKGNPQVLSSGISVIDSSCLTFIPFPPGIICPILSVSGPIFCMPTIVSWSCSIKKEKIGLTTIITQNCKANCSIGGELSFISGPKNKVFAE